MLPLTSSLLLFLLIGPALLTSSTSTELEVGGQRRPKDAEQDSIKVVISEGCTSQGDSPNASQGGKEINLDPGSPLVLTHRIKLVPSGSGSGLCGCEADFAALRERLESLEREVSSLREKCGGAEGSCCTSESKGAGCSIKPKNGDCPNECSDQGRCVDGKCVCFAGYGGPDCSQSNCPGNCNNNGRCVNGECVCDPGFTGLDCSQRVCPDNCNNQGRCVNGKCVCDSGFTGPSCSEESCPGNCNKRGRCVNGQCVCNPGFTGSDCTKRACPNNCNNRGRCVNGKCICKSGFTNSDCSEKACPRNCNNKGNCINGECVCNDGFTGADCSKKSCPNNCSNRGRCVNGKCVCESGFTNVDCSEIACPRNCNNKGNCINGQCVCNDGFTGADCSEQACPNNCNNRGTCVDGKCVCDSGFASEDCSEIACPENCNNRGRCISGQCVCNDGFTGADCSEQACPNNCNNRGRCVDGDCVCDSGFTSKDCSEIACPGNCNNKGNCVNGQCVCNDGFTGADCSEHACPNNCNNRGRCVDGECVCDSGFTSEDCSEIACPGNCNNRGHCISGQCVCDDGFTGADCLKKACLNGCNKVGRCVDGECVCNSGFTGTDCSEIACPGNCNNRGRCISGQCVCDDGFTDADCSEKACPSNCNNRGRCVDGKCVCDSGFTRDDCSELACPGNCNNRGRCINGQCVCHDGFTGTDCSEKACPNNCNNRGRCMNGKCVCNVGFAGPDCSAKGCPNNCNNKGRCFKGRCVCRPGFTGPDCNQCQEGKTGPKCNIVMTGVSQLSTQDLTESSVTLVWTQPSVQYESYYITFTSQKEEDQQITSQVNGSLTTFTQTGLAAGQEYSVRIVGEFEGRRGVESTTEFTTLISGPTNLQVVKTTSTSAVVQWESSQGQVDRYRLTFLPSDGAGTSREMSVPAGQTSAHIGQLEAGRLYDILLVAERGLIQSQQVRTQVVPGNTLSSITTKNVAMQVTQAPGHDVGSKDQELNPTPAVQVVDQQGGRNRDSANVEDSSASVSAKTKPLVGKMVARNGTRFRVVGRPTLSKPKVPLFHFNATRTTPGGRLVPGSVRKPSTVADKKEVIEIKNTQPDVLPTWDFGKDQSEETSSSEKSDDISPTVMPGGESETNRQRGSVEPTSAIGSKRQPDVGIAPPGNDTDLVSLNTTGTIQSQEKKCLNKIKVTHFRLPLKDRGNKYRGNVTRLQGNALRSDPNGTPHHGATDLDYTPDPLHKLITDTFENLNITKISVHMFKPLNLSTDADAVRMQILRGLEPLTGSASESSSHEAVEPSSLRKPLISSSLLPPPSSLPPSSQSLLSLSSSSSSDEFDSHGSNELISSTNSPSPEDSKLSHPDKNETPLSHQNPLNRGSVRHVYPNFELLQNRTHQNLRVPHQSSSDLSHTPKQETEVILPGKDMNSDKDAKPTPASSLVKQGQKRILRGKIPVRRPSLKGSFPRQPFPNGQNQTRFNLRYSPQPSQFSNPEVDTKKEQAFPTELPSSSSSVSDALTSEGNKNVGTKPSTTNSSNELDQTTRRRGLPFFRRPFVRQSQQNGESLQNKTFTNLRQRQYPVRGSMRKFLPIRKQNLGNFTAGGQTTPLRKDNTRENHETQSPYQNVRRSFHSSLTNTSGEQENNQLSQMALTNVHKTTATKKKKELEKGDNALIEVKAPTGFTSHKERLYPGRNISAANRDSPSIINNFRTSRPVKVPRRHPPPGSLMAKPRSNHSISESQNKEHLKTNYNEKSILDTKTEERNGTESDVSSSGVIREPLDFVGVTNRTSHGYTLVWETPEGKYDNFLVSRTEVRQEEGLQQKESTQNEDKDENIQQSISEKGGDEDNRISEGLAPQISSTQDGTAAKSTGSSKTFKKVLPGSARSLPFEHLPPQTEYTLTLLGGGPGLLSRLHKLVISTGPEPPSNIIFSMVTENSLTVSWTKPKSPVSGFKVTYTHSDDDEPVSVSVDSEDSTLNLSQLSPGSSYEVTVLSTLGLDESDPITDVVMTLPDPPTDLQAMNVTDTTALLLWRPALAAVDKYAIIYGSGTGSELRVTVSGNAAEQQLTGLEGSTTYTVTITSQLGSQESSPASTSFTTAGRSAGDSVEARNLQAKNVTPRTALVSWRPPLKPGDGYLLIYQAEGEKSKEVIVGPSETQYKLTRLHPGSLYNVNLRTLRGAHLTGNTFTTFTTGNLRFPFPTDCSQELLNGIRTSEEVEIFPQGKLGKSLLVYCDMETDGGGWTVFQRRKDGSEDFYRGFVDYVKGFGNLSGEFWLGLENIHSLTATTRMNLRVDLRDGGERVFAQYSTFMVAKRQYRLTVDGYSGTAGDSLSYHNNHVFSTKDRDPAPGITRCAISYQGGWWYNNCHEANLNGLYGNNFQHQGLIWKSWKGEDHSIQFTEMKMRPANFRTPSSG